MITLFWTVFFCLGLRIASDEGQLLYFLRKPFDLASYYIQIEQEKLKLWENFPPEKPVSDVLKKSLRQHKLILNIGKPLIYCITCMASIWGGIIFISLNGLHGGLITPLILNSFAASFIQTFMWSLYVRYIQ